MMAQPPETDPPSAGRADPAMPEVLEVRDTFQTAELSGFVGPTVLNKTPPAQPPPPPDTTRHLLSVSLVILFVIAVLIGPVLSVVAIFYFDCCDDQDRLSSLIEKFTLLGTSLTGTVAGVFGSVMGFYFGREQAEAQNAKQ